MGTCIRCGDRLRADLARPYCGDCYSIWIQFENPEYPEKVCHLCAKPNPSTMRKPACRNCYEKFKDVMPFPAARW